MYEIGPGLGASWVYGDINRSAILYNPALAADFLFRYNVNLRWAISLDFASLGLKGDSRDFDNVMPGDGPWSFDRRYWRFGIRPEFSFWNYGWGADYREKHRVAPFLTAGVEFGWSGGDVEAPASAEVSNRSNAVVSLPVGLGLKWKVAPRWDVQMTCLWSKCLNDEADGISDPYATRTHAPQNTDWIGSLMMHVTFSFGERCLECHNQNEW